MSRHYTDRDRILATAAREAKRLAEPYFSDEPRRKIRIPRSRTRFRITIRDEKIGDSLTLSLTPLPWRGRFIDSDRKELSTASVCKMVKTALNFP
jgi:hypothetical protein